MTLPSPAQFLFILGLRRYPPAEVVLDIAAKGGSQGTVALHYFLDNYKSHMDYRDYTTYACENIAFVPAIQRGEKKLAKPVEVFSNPDWESLGFHVLDSTLGKGAVDKLGIMEHPPTSQVVHCLKASPPTTESQACKWFGILSHRISGLCNIQSEKYVCADFCQISLLLSWLHCLQCALFLPLAILLDLHTPKYHHQTNATSRVNLPTSCIQNSSLLSTLVLQQTGF